MTDRPILTVSELNALATLLRAVQTCAKVSWIDPNSERVIDGTARCFAHFGGGFLGQEDDVRDHYVHVSGLFESWLPVADVIPIVKAGTFCVQRSDA